jgi:hypothetical protein
MKNKGITYIALGIGAGIVAYYLFCRKKAKEQLQEVVEQQQQEPQKETRKGVIGGGGGFAPASPITSRPLYATPVATTPVNVSVTTTSTPTPTVTPVIVYMANLRTGGYYQDVCGSTYFGNPANVTIYSEKPFSQLEIGDHVYGNSQLTIPPINANFTISNGSTFIQIGGTLIINKGICG